MIKMLIHKLLLKWLDGTCQEERTTFRTIALRRFQFTKQGNH